MSPPPLRRGAANTRYRGCRATVFGTGSVKPSSAEDLGLLICSQLGPRGCGGKPGRERKDE